MADRILSTKAAFTQAIGDVKNSYDEMTQLAETLETKIQNLLAEWEGDAKQAFKAQWENIRKAWKEDVPNAILGVQQIIESVDNTFTEVDEQLAAGINGNS